MPMSVPRTSPQLACRWLRFRRRLLAFANQPLNTTSAAQTITLSNTGNATLTITSVSITGTNPGDFAQTKTCGTTLAAGANCTISVTFKPTVAAARSATISVTDNAGGSPQTVPLSGTGTSPAAQLSPTSLAFGVQVINTTSSSRAVTLSNTGNSTMSITSIAFTGTNAADFARTTTCGATLAAGANCSISVTFRPTATGSRTANLSVSDNAPGTPHTIPLTGTGTAVTVSPTSLTFTSQAVGTTSAAKAVTADEFRYHRLNRGQRFVHRHECCGLCANEYVRDQRRCRNQLHHQRDIPADGSGHANGVAEDRRF